MPKTTKYGEVHPRHVLWIILVFLSLAPYAVAQIILHYLTALHIRTTRNATLGRRLSIVLPRYLTTHLIYPEIQFLLGDSLRVLRLWAKVQQVPWTEVKLQDSSEERRSQNISDQQAHLVFFGPAPSPGRKVILFLPGGGYVNPIIPNTLSFLCWIQSQLENVTVAILSYRLRPSGTFPAPLTDALLALRHITTTLQIPLHDLQLAGDSAGGHLVLQTLAILAGKVSLPGLPRVPAFSNDENQLAGVLLISPWVCLATEDSWNDRYDTLERKTYASWGKEYLADLAAYFEVLPSIKTNGPHASPVDLKAFIDPFHASPTYFSFLSKLTPRVYITSGAKECMALSGAHRRLIDSLCGKDEYNLHAVNGHGVEVRSVIQSDGVHGDPMLDFMFWFRGWRHYLWGTGMSRDIMDWLKAGFSL